MYVKNKGGIGLYSHSPRSKCLVSHICNKVSP